MEQNDVTPLVSVMVSLYYVSSNITECLESIWGQTYYNLEVVLVDDGFPDDSAKRLSIEVLLRRVFLQSIVFLKTMQLSFDGF